MRGSRTVAIGLSSIFILLGGCGSSDSGSGSFGTLTGDSSGNSAGNGSGSGSNGGASSADGIVNGITGGAGSTSASAGSSTGAGGDAGLCAQQHVNGSSNANVLLVVDRSTSMGETPTGANMTKWSQLLQALPPALMAVQSGVSFGLELFPTPGADSCSVSMGNQGIQIPIGPGAMTVPQIDMRLNQRNSGPGGSTPTSSALETALAYFTTGAGAQLPGNKYVLLATDGGPNCNSSLMCDAAHCTLNIDAQQRGCSPTSNNCCTGNNRASCLDDARGVTAIGNLAAAGVKTFVVGIPGTEAYESILDAFATAGQEVNPMAPPSYYAVSASAGVAGLQAVLTSITQTVIKTCTFQLETTPPAGNYIAIYVDDNLTTQDTDWTLDSSTNPPTVVLQGGVCDNVIANGAQSVDIEVFCPGVVPPPHIHVN